MHKFVYGQELAFSAKRDGSSEFEFLLPEYLPGISRIVRTSAKVEKCSVREDSNDTSVDISLAFSVIYISDFGGRIKNAVFRENVSLNFANPIPVGDNLTTLVSAYVSSVTSKLETTRKIHTVCSYSANISCLKHSECEMLDDESQEKVCVLKKKTGFCSKTAISAPDFEYEADITIDSGKQPVGEIIFADAVFCEASCNSHDSYLDFEGKLMLHVLYEISSDDGNEAASYAVINTPITVRDTLSDDRINENMLSFIHLDVLSAEPTVSFDTNGENRVISLKLGYCADAFVYETEEMELITDAFCESFESTPAVSDITVQSLYDEISDTVHISQPVRVDIKELSDISGCKAKIQSVTMEHTDGKIFAAAKCFLEILGTNAMGELCSVDSTVTLHIPVYSSENSNSELLPDVLLSVKNCHAKIKEGELTADFDICVQGVILSINQTKVVTSLEIDKSLSKASSKGEVIIYYPQNGDSLWSIAKKYGANPDVLSQINKLENGDISSRHTILIP